MGRSTQFVPQGNSTMNSIKTFGLFGLAAAGLLLAGQASATTCPAAPVGGSATQGAPTCVATNSTDPGNVSLNQLYGAGGSQVTGTGLDIYNGQYTPSSQWQIGSTTGSFNIILKEVAGNANLNTFGIYDPTDPSNVLMIFNGPDSAGAKGTLVYNGNGEFQYAPFGGAATTAHFGDGASFGYYLGTPNGVFYSNPVLNNSADEAGNPYADGMHHMVAYQGGNGTNINVNGVWGSMLNNEFLLAWEDQPFKTSDLDYNDFIVLVESVHSVPEPAVLGMFGLGLLLIGAGVAFRRRQHEV
jgi:hypothetical protein